MSETRLELQIVSESKSAIDALDSLATTLGRIRRAVSRGFTKENSENIASFGRALKDSVTGGTVKRYERLANAMEKLRKASSGIKGISALNAGNGKNGAAESLAALSDSMKTASSDLARSVDAAGVRESGEAYREAGIEIEHYAESVNHASDSVRDGGFTDVQSQIEGTAEAAQPAGDTIANSVRMTADEYVNSMSKVDLLRMKLESLKGALNEGIISGQFDDAKIARYALEIQNLQEKIEKLDAASDKSKSGIKSLSDAMKELFRSAGEAKRPFSHLMTQFGRIAKYRFLRTVLKEIAEGFKFGFENMYQYAKLVGNSFAPAVDSANNAIFKMKNSLGAALAPAFQMIIPYVVQLVQWFINLVNIVNQFLALLRGQSTWTKATDAPASTLDKVKKKAKGASESVKELKGLLADWDELNIIQQETGGGGGGSGSIAADESAKYGLLFEEVSTFDENVQRIVEKVKEFVQWIKDNMDTILNIAKLIGVAILGWKVSSWFGGIIGTLIGWATTGIIAALTFKITLDNDEKYLETGDTGYLVKNILTSAVGATAAGILMKTITGSSLSGAVAFSAVLTVSAIADIIAALGKTDVSALSEKNLGLALVSALKLGLASTVLSKALGSKYMKSGLIGLGVTLLVLSAEIGLKAVLQDIADAGEINGESVLAKIVSAVGAIAGVTALGMGAFKLPFGSAFFTGLAAGGLLLAVEFGIQAVVADANADVSGINWPSILLSLSSGMAAAGAVFSITKGRFGWKMGKSLFASASAALTTIAVELGVEAFVSTQNAGTEGVTTDSLIKSLSGGLTAFGAVTTAGKTLGWELPASMQAGLIAAGAFLTVSLGVNAVVGTLNAKKLTTNNVLAAIGASAGAGIMSAAALIKGGAELSVAMATGGVTALATGLVIAAAIGVALSLSQKNPIAWGNVSLTEEQIKTFVYKKLFDAKARVALKLVKDTVEMDETEKQKVEVAAGELFTTLNVVQLGVDTTNSIPKMIEQFNTLRATLQSYSRTRITALETSITLSPVVSESGEDLSAQFLSESITGWDLINNGMYNLGQKLSQTFINSTTGKLKENWDKDAAQEIIKKVSAINSAVLGAQIQGEAKNNLQAGLLGLDPTGADGKWSKESFDKAIKMYDDYITEMRNGYIQAFQGDALAAEMQAALLRALLPDVTDEKLRKKYEDEISAFEAQALVFRNTVAERVEKAMAENAGQGESMLAEWFTSILNPDKISEILGNGRYTASIVTEFNKALKNDLKPDEALSEAVKQTMMSSPALAELIPYMDRFGIDAASLLSDSLREKLMGVIGGAFTGAAASSDTKEAAQNAAEEVVSAAEEAVKDSRRSMSEAIIDAGAVGWVTAGSEAGKEIINGLAQEFSDDAGGLVQMLADAYGWSIEDILGNIDLSQMDGEQIQQFLESWNNSDLGLIYELDIDDESFNLSVPAPDTSPLTSGLEQTEASVAKNCQNIRAWFESLNGLSFTFSGDAMGGSMSVSLPPMPKITMAANGGMFTAGEMFIAREAGPEMVGRIGNRTGVANNNQIVDGITTGVASGQAEQNALLRQQNEYLRQMLAKESTVRVQPSTAWGEFNRKSSEMYARATGRG